MWILRRKWKDSPHYGSEGRFLGEDQYGMWLGAGPGNRMYKGTGPILSGKYPIVWCVPREGWFLAHFLVGHPELTIYIDITTPATWRDRSVKLVDLDLDVIVWRDGRAVELVDEDEFELHRLELEYPDAVVVVARAAAEAVFQQASAGDEPFAAECAAPWFRAMDDLL